MPAPTKFVKSIGADWTYLIKIIELVCPHPVKPDVVIKLVRVRRQLFGHTILIPGEGIIFLLGVSDARGLHAKEEIGGETDCTWVSFVIFCRSQDSEGPVKIRKHAGPEGD